MTIGKLIKKARIERGLTQKELGNMTGVATITIRQYEADKRTPSIEQFNKIVSALNINMTDFEEIPLDPNQKAVYSLGYLLNQFTEIGKEWLEAEKEIENKLLNAFYSLNSDGKIVAVERVEELTEIPRYQREPEETPQLVEKYQKEQKETPQAGADPAGAE